MTTKITSSIDNHIGNITLNHPEKHNILCQALRDELTHCYTEFENNPEVKIILLNANGKHFCAGADLKEMITMSDASFEANFQDAQNLIMLFHQIYTCKKPTICLAHGKTMGGGLGLLAVNDITIAPHTAQFCFPEVKLGMLPATIAPFITQRTGFTSAQLLMLTAELFSATYAHQIKLIDYLSDDNPIELAFSTAEKLLKNNLSGMQATKQWLRTLHPITPEQLNQAAKRLANIRSTPEAKSLLKQAICK